MSHPLAEVFCITRHPCREVDLFLGRPPGYSLLAVNGRQHQLSPAWYRLLRPKLERVNPSVRGQLNQPEARQTIGFQAHEAVFPGQEPGQNPRRQSGDESGRAPPADERGR